MTGSNRTLAARAEAAIRELRDIEGVSVRAEGEDILEIHVLTGTQRPLKQIVRDVQTVLRTRLDVRIDHRVVSIAHTQPADARPTESAVAPAEARLEGEPEPELPRTDERIRFEGVNLFVSGPRTQAQVELRWRGLPRIGSAAGWSARDEAHHLVARATAAAVQEFLAEPIALDVQGVEFEAFGRHRVVVVALSLVAHRQEKLLTGSCRIEQDTPQAVALAALDALNRIVGGLRVKEPTEYVLRPTTG